MSRSRAAIKKNIIDYMKSESKVRKDWAYFSLREIARSVGEDKTRVESLLKELARDGQVTIEENRYTTGPVIRAGVSKQIQDEEDQRLLNLKPEDLAVDDPDYLNKAIREAALSVQQVDPQIAGVIHSVDEGRQANLAVQRQGVMYRTRVNLSQATDDLAYHDLVAHIRNILLSAR